MIWRGAGITLILDQLSKLVIVHWLNLINLRVIDVAAPYLTLRMGWNRGINFGLFSGGEDWMRWVMIAVALGIIAYVLNWMRGESDRRALASAGLLIGGALGNIVDRLSYGAVADFLNMSCCGITNPFVFNVADIAIFFGAAGLMIWGRDAPRPKGA